MVDNLHPWVAAARGREGGPRWLQDLRERGAARFAALGFPTVRDEEWRFTNIAPIADRASSGARTGPASVTDVAARRRCSTATRPHRVVVVNGQYRADLSRREGAAGGRSRGLAGRRDQRDLDADSEIVQRYLGQLADFGVAAVRRAQHRARFEDGAFIHVPDGMVVEQPLHVIFVSTGEESGVATVEPPALPDRRRAPNAQARLVETYVGTGASVLHERGDGDLRRRERHPRSLQGPGGSVEAFHVASMHVHASRSATFSSHSFALGGKLVRNDAIAILDGEGAECTLNGLYLADGDRLVDNHTDDRSRQGALPEPRDLQGHPRRARPRGVQRQDHRPPRRAEDRRQADQPRAAALRQRVDQHQAAARDLRRRRQVHARGGDRTARRRRDLLPARARPHVRGGARHADPRLRRRRSSTASRSSALKRALETELYAQLAKDLAEADAG